MEAEQVIDKILSDAKAEAERIKSEAEEKAGAEQAKLEGELEHYRQESQERAERAAEDKRQRMLAAARMEAAKELLAEKVNIVDEVFAQAEEQLKALPEEEYIALMTKLMKAAVETGDEEVIVDKEETRIDQKLIKNLNRELGPGHQGSLRLSEEQRDIDGGFILRRGKIQNNVSLPVLLAQARNELEIELAKELFAD